MLDNLNRASEMLWLMIATVHRRKMDSGRSTLPAVRPGNIFRTGVDKLQPLASLTSQPKNSIKVGICTCILSSTKPFSGSPTLPPPSPPTIPAIKNHKSTLRPFQPKRRHHPHRLHARSWSTATVVLYLRYTGPSNTSSLCV